MHLPTGGVNAPLVNELGRLLFLCGIVMTVAGFALWKFAGKTPLGRLPGDLAIQRPGFSLYFPLTTCIVISVVLTLLIWLFRR